MSGDSGYGWQNGSLQVVRSVALPEGKIGLVIGKGGSTIKKLRQLNGVFDVNINSAIGNVTVQAKNQISADNVVEEIMALIAMNSGNRPAFTNNILDAGGRTQTDSVSLFLRQYDDEVDRFLPYLDDRSSGGRPLVLASSVEDQLCSNFALMSLHNTSLSRLLSNEIEFLRKMRISLPIHGEPIQCPTVLLQKALNELSARLNGHTKKVLIPMHDFVTQKDSLGVDISLRIGNFTFSGENAGKLPQMVGPGCAKNFSPKLRPEKVRIPNVVVSQWEKIESRRYTTCHVTDCSTGLKISVRLALDEDDPLKALDIAKDDRVSEKKKAAIQCVQKATTLYEVLGIENIRSITDAMVKKAYFVKSLLLHPDKNGFPEATEAFKLLGLAMEKLETMGNRRSNGDAKITSNPVRTCTMPAQLPKVLGVMSDRLRVGCFTTMRLTPGELGVRWVIATASLDDSNDGAAQRACHARVVRVMEEAWGSQIEGEISIPSVDTKVYADCLKQVASESWTDGNYVLVWKRVKESSGIYAKKTEYVEIDLWSYDIYDRCAEFSEGTLSEDGFIEALQTHFVELKTLVDKLFN